MLLFQAFELPVSFTVILSLASAIAGVLVTIFYFRSGLQEKTIAGYKELHAMEEKRANALEVLLEKRDADLLKCKSELSTLSEEYSGVSQLFAKKSFMLEALTGDLELRVKLVRMIRALDIDQMEEIRAIHLSLDATTEKKGVL